MDQTPSTGDSPTIRKRALARKLVEHRQRRSLTTTDVQRRLGWSATKLNWIEKARWTESVTDSVADLCELYEIGGPERDALITLARQSRERGWWTRYNDVFGREELPGWEAGASKIWTFETAFIPGLLQTPDYIELITRAAGIAPREYSTVISFSLPRKSFERITSAIAPLKALSTAPVAPAGMAVPSNKFTIIASAAVA